MFMPEPRSEGMRTVSAEISEGAFSVPPRNELMAGSYKVAVTAERNTGRKVSADEGSNELVDERRQYIPPEYNARTTLSAVISTDIDDLEFALELPDKR